MKYTTLALAVILLVGLYVLGHHEWHHAIVTGMNAITSFFTGSS